MADQQFIDALHEQDKIDQLTIDLNLAQYDNAVLSVNGKTGDIVLSTTDVAEGTNLYYTNARVDARLSGLIDDLLTATDKTWSSTKIANAILNGEVETATKWASPMSYTFSGDVVGSGSFDGSTGITVNATVPGKVNNSRVLTDVPAGAVFTDTLYNDSSIWNAVNLNTGKVGITQAQADAIDLNTAKYSYPPADSSKLSLIEAQAQKNVQSDWDQTNDLQNDYIKNKPPIVPAMGKNILINGDMKVNQRDFDGSSWVNGEYAYDRWKATATAMVQIIEDRNYEPSTEYTLSGEGVTTQQITSPSSGNWTISEVPRTARKIQLEKGSVATEYGDRLFGYELTLCERYFCTSYPRGWAPGSAISLGAVTAMAFGQGSAKRLFPLNNRFRAKMRTTPTILVWDENGAAGYMTAYNNSHSTGINSISGFNDSAMGVYANVAVATTENLPYLFQYTADAEF